MWTEQVSTTRTKKILCVTDEEFKSEHLAVELPDWCDLVFVDVGQMNEALQNDTYDGFLFLSSRDHETWQFWHLAQNATLLDQMPDGFAIVDEDNKIIWSNKRLTSWFNKESIVGLNFFEALDRPEILGGSGSPLAIALKTGKPYTAMLRLPGHRYYRLQAAPVLFGNQEFRHNAVTVSDISGETLHLQKLEAIHNAGAELADLTPEEIVRMNVDERIELLKANILYYTQDLLNYDVVEIRLIDQKTNRCEPLLSVGIDSEESKRPLLAEPQGNGVTGFVCATGKSYLCEVTTNDPLYVGGLIGAKSSLTVPLLLHEEVIGSFNVESPEIGAFKESDLQLLRIFARDIARALNTLELLVAQKTSSTQQSLEAIDTAVATPIDEILNDTVHVIENFIGHDPEVIRRLRNILKHTRDVKQVIYNAREQMAHDATVPDTVHFDQRPLLKRSRILVIDSDEDVRKSAHQLLEQYGCIVETAHEGKEAILMIRNCDPGENYDVIIADIRLPDLTGYQILTELKKIIDDPPLVLMTGYGYDPGHSIVKARQAGLKPNAVLFKPFKLEQLLETVESMISGANRSSE